MKKIVLLASLITTFAFAQFNYQLSIKPGGNFDIQIQMRLKHHNDPAKVYYELFLDSKNQEIVNENFVKQSYSEGLEKDLYKKGAHQYTIETHVSKSVFTANIVNNCDLNVYARQVKTDCTVQSSKAGVLGNIFHWGSTDINCIELDNNVDCHVHIRGKNKGFNIPVRKTNDRLAISGSMKTVKDIYKAFNLLNDGLTNKRTDDFYKANLFEVWEELIEKLDRKDKLKANLSVMSSPIGVMID
jgi:hypothetical protein